MVTKIFDQFFTPLDVKYIFVIVIVSNIARVNPAVFDYICHGLFKNKLNIMLIPMMERNKWYFWIVPISFEQRRAFKTKFAFLVGSKNFSRCFIDYLISIEILTHSLQFYIKNIILSVDSLDKAVQQIQVSTDGPFLKLPGDEYFPRNQIRGAWWQQQIQSCRKTAISKNCI